MARAARRVVAGVGCKPSPEAMDEVIDWLTFYNHRRLHSTLGEEALIIQRALGSDLDEGEGLALVLSPSQECVYEPFVQVTQTRNCVFEASLKGGRQCP
jgi:hypothetical protein